MNLKQKKKRCFTDIFKCGPTSIIPSSNAFYVWYFLMQIMYKIKHHSMGFNLGAIYITLPNFNVEICTLDGDYSYSFVCLHTQHKVLALNVFNPCCMFFFPSRKSKKLQSTVYLIFPIIFNKYETLIIHVTRSLEDGR